MSVAVANPAASGHTITNAAHGSKRKHSETDDDSVPLVSQSKRVKVAFDPDVEVRIVEDWNEKGLDLVREEVRRAIERHSIGDSAAYDQLKQLFAAKPSSEDAPSTALLRKYVVALTGHVNMLSKSSSGLVYALLDCQWLGRDEGFIGLYLRLLGSIMSVHGGYSAAVLKMLVKYFTNLPTSAGRLPTHAILSRQQLQTRIHQALKYLLRLIPSASGVLSSILSSAFPFSTDTTKAHTEYISNLLTLTEYAPELKGEILALITERLVKIDVQMQVDMEDLEDEVEEDLLQEVMQRQSDDEQEAEDDLNESDNESVSSEESVEPEERRVRDLKQAVNKMDAILELLFDYYHPVFAKGTIISAEDTFDHMLSQFSSTILPTYRSRHTQFLLFHFGQTSEALIERFVGACAHLSFDRARPHIMRLAAAAYLASFIARGAHVSARIVRDVFGLLSDHLESLRQAHEHTATGPDLRRFGGYYAIAQALIYIFCFRWRDLIISGDDDGEDDEDILFDGRDLRWVAGIKEVLTNNIYSKLNPLKICSPAIVTQFARIAHHLRFMYVFPLLETNKRLRLSRSLASASSYGGLAERETALSGKTGESAFQLDAYFPFDPYHLPKSKRWMEGDYVEWKSIPGLDDVEQGDDSDSDSGDEDMEDEQDFEERTETEADSE